MKQLLFATIFALSIAMFVPSLALAQPADPGPTPSPTSTWDGKIDIKDNITETNLDGFASKLIIWSLGVIALVATIIIIYAGILLVFNGGSEARVAQAKRTLTWAIIGLAVAVGAFAIVSIIQGVFS